MENAAVAVLVPDDSGAASGSGAVSGSGGVSDTAPDAAAGGVPGAVTVGGLVGDADRLFRLASVSKLLSAYAVLIAVEEGVFGLDDPAGPPGSTIAHLLAHTSGLEFSGSRVLADPGRRRVYSNTGFDVLGETLQKASGIVFADYLAESVFTPLGMDSSELRGSPAHAVWSNVHDMIRFAAELLAPRLLAPSTFALATSVAFPGTAGVLPGFGVQKPNDWGLGFEIRGGKQPHWTGSTNSPATFGHFGRSGTFLWVDPAVRSACVALTDREFGTWAAEAWPVLSDDVVAAVRMAGIPR